MEQLIRKHVFAEEVFSFKRSCARTAMAPGTAGLWDFCAPRLHVFDIISEFPIDISWLELLKILLANLGSSTIQLNAIGSWEWKFGIHFFLKLGFQHQNTNPPEKNHSIPEEDFIEFNHHPTITNNVFFIFFGNKS